MKSPNSEYPHCTVLPMLMFPLSHSSMCFPLSVSLKHPGVWSRNWVSIGNRPSNRNCVAISGRGGDFSFLLKCLDQLWNPLNLLLSGSFPRCKVTQM